MSNLLDIYNTFSSGFGGVNRRLEYPLENQGDYLGRITFTPVVEDAHRVNMSNNVESLVTVVKEEIKEFGRDLADVFTRKEDEQASTHQLMHQDAADTESIKLKAANQRNFTNSFYGRDKMKSAPAFDAEDLTLDTSKKISLYLPRAIQIQDTVSYDNQFQLGLIGGAIEAGLKDKGIVGSLVGAIANEAGGLANTVLGRGKGMSPEAAGILSGKIAAKVPIIGDQAGGAVRSGTGLTTNPNTRAIFQNVPIRNFSFSFQLIPTSQNEARAIEEIIKTFRTELYPEALRAGNVNVGYRFPNRFLIKVRYNNRDIKGIKFLPVYLQSFNAVYNSATGGMHSDGRFSGVDISMTFTETRAISKADIVGGY